MKNNHAIKHSKFLSLILRHKPETVKIDLDENGWVDIDLLIRKINDVGKKLTREELYFIVENNPKKRFAIDEANNKIRANQGHSLNINLGFEPIQPPEFLFHGTAQRFLESIIENGLEKRNRHHVHLSPDKDTATNVGQRHGKPIILEVKALEMYKDGFQFFVSENGVWLTDKVPSKYFSKDKNNV
ncbi:MAG: RNA 2'-phosphotransferase [Saprospiraceae bacterium]